MSSDRKPTLRDGTIYDIRDAVQGALQAAFEKGIMTTCITCIDFNEPTELCQRFKERPPARVIAYGCKSYTHDDEIPF